MAINWKLILKEPRWVIKITIRDWFYKIIKKKRHPLEYRVARNIITDKLYRVLPDQQLYAPYVEVGYYGLYDWKGRLIPQYSSLVRLTEEKQRRDYTNATWRFIWDRQ